MLGFKWFKKKRLQGLFYFVFLFLVLRVFGTGGDDGWITILNQVEHGKLVYVGTWYLRTCMYWTVMYVLYVCMYYMYVLYVCTVCVGIKSAGFGTGSNPVQVQFGFLIHPIQVSLPKWPNCICTGCPPPGFQILHAP